MTASTSTQPRLGSKTAATTTAATANQALLPRFQLRKRSTVLEKPLGFNAVNSAFLSGLFADVAHTTEDSSSSKRSTRDDARLDQHFQAGPTTKKSRISLAHSISRCAMSVKNLEGMVSPTACDTDFFDPIVLARQDSLLLQLSCVGASTGDSAIAFPHLPATISQSSCSGSLTRNLSDLQSSVAENEMAETYGWFVEVDADGPIHVVKDPYQDAAAAAKNTLAFSAATAPCADDHADEVEWAKAADTVDDVLGDFF